MRHAVRAGEMMAEQCEWTLDNADENIWETSCGEMFVFDTGGPEENDFIYCPFCGKRIVVKG